VTVRERYLLVCDPRVVDHRERSTHVGANQEGFIVRDTLTKLVISSGLVLTTIGVAEAKDLCITTNLFGNDGIVGQGFSIPGKNRCKPFNGFVGSGPDWIATGTGCTNADGSLFRVSIIGTTSSTNNSNPIHLNCTLPQPALTGGSCLITLGFPADPSNEMISVTTTGVSAQRCDREVP
jgi:hypothetical protein